MRRVALPLLATLVGLAMVGGGIWGLVADVSDDDGDAVASQTRVPKTSSPEECAQMAKRDKRFRFPHTLTFGGAGTATVKCNGTTVTYTIEIDGLESGRFYDVVLEKGKREEEVGSILAVGGGNTISTVTIGPEIKTKRYDFLTVRLSEFGQPPTSSPEDEFGLTSFSAAL